MVAFNSIFEIPGRIEATPGIDVNHAQFVGYDGLVAGGAACIPIKPLGCADNLAWKEKQRGAKGDNTENEKQGKGKIQTFVSPKMFESESIQNLYWGQAANQFVAP